MEAYNLRGWEMGTRKRKSQRDLRPETTTTSNRRTGVKEDQRERCRFSVGERVAWDGGAALVLGTVHTIEDGGNFITVRIDDGRYMPWPTTDPRVRRIQTAALDDSLSEISAIGHPTLSLDRLDSSYYESVDFAEEEGTLPTVEDILDATYTDDMRRR